MHVLKENKDTRQYAQGVPAMQQQAPLCSKSSAMSWGRDLSDIKDNVLLCADFPIAGQIGERGFHLPVASQGSKGQWLPLLQDPQQEAAK